MDHTIDVDNNNQHWNSRTAKSDHRHDPAPRCPDLILAVHQKQQLTEKDGVDLSGGAVRSPSPSSSNGERVCRICHLSGNGDGEEDSCSSMGSEFIELGCGCKDELGISHYQCAHAWFSLKRTRKCEICGKTAKNIDGIEETRGMNIRMHPMEFQPNTVAIQNIIVAPIEGHTTNENQFKLEYESGT
ncbi:hypothetical protein V2J09_020942 [Rumex salicifolius]